MEKYHSVITILFLVINYTHTRVDFEPTTSPSNQLLWKKEVPDELQLNGHLVITITHPAIMTIDLVNIEFYFLFFIFYFLGVEEQHFASFRNEDVCTWNISHHTSTCLFFSPQKKLYMNSKMTIFSAMQFPNVNKKK